MQLCIGACHLFGDSTMNRSFQPITLPTSKGTTNASASGDAGATCNASETLVTLGAQSFIWRGACGLGETTLALEPASVRKTSRFSGTK